MKKFLAVVFLAVMVASVSMSASAHVGNGRRLRFQTSDTGSAQWQYNRVDSPLDANAGRLKLAVAEQDGDDYAIAFANGTGIRNRDVDTVRNLSFDFRTTSYVGAGAPRISVEVDTNNDFVTDVYVYLSAFYCGADIGSGWSRADFTGRLAAGCLFYTSEPGSPTYVSDGVEDAWTKFANLHSGARVLDAYVVMDEVGQAFIDRIAFQNHMFTRGASNSTGIVHCPNEGSC
jgi:hypothetical protein